MKSLKVRGLYFSAGHRIPGHSYCYKPHGHTYFVDVTYIPKSDKLNEMGMIIDFGDLKGGIRDYLKDNWDHRQIITWNGEEVDAWTELYNKLGIELEYLKLLRYTTAEHMQELITEGLTELFPDAETIIVELFEGPMQGIGSV